MQLLVMTIILHENFESAEMLSAITSEVSASLAATPCALGSHALRLPHRAAGRLPAHLRQLQYNKERARRLLYSSNTVED